jgi:flagellar hook protein FlgE
MTEHRSMRPLSQPPAAEYLDMRMDAIAVSGLRAHELMSAVAADNVANVNTAGYRAKSVDLAASPNGGVEVTAVGDRRDGDVPEGFADVDLAEETATQIVAELGYSASARVIRAQDEVSGALIDIVG